MHDKSKDNLKSKLDLPLICSRECLHILPNGRCPKAAYHLDTAKTIAFMEWIRDSVKFPDGYASNLRNCIDFDQGKLVGLKSHDCHVFMQRLLPFAFTYLLPKDIHKAIGGKFFFLV